MIRYLVILILFPLLLHAQGIKSIHELFDSLKTNPQTLRDQINMERAEVGENLAYSNLFPTIKLFGKYDYSTDPSGMQPLTPNEMFPMIKDQTIPQPFSERILRAGATISMPIFVKSIFTMASKAKMMYKSAESKKYINLLKNEAILVGANANLLYMENLEKALDKKKNSLLKTKEIVDIKVKEGRAPESAQLKINSGINSVDIMKNEVTVNKEKALQLINSLTGIRLEQSIPMKQVENLLEGKIKALEPLRNKLMADSLAYRAEKEKLWPVLVLNGNYNFSFADAYNNNIAVKEKFGTVSLTLSVPLFTMTQYRKIEQEGLLLKATETEMKKMNLQLRSQAIQLKNSLPIIIESISLYKKSVGNKEKLLKIARVSYDSGRMSVEDYLKYEDDLLMERAKLYKAQASQWQTTMKLAVIFGNNIEEIVK